jgi:sugar lactone lactonase YvrE
MKPITPSHTIAAPLHRIAFLSFVLLALTVTQGHAATSQAPQMDLLLRPSGQEFAISVAFSPKGQMFLAYVDSSIRTLPPGRNDLLKYASTGLDFNSKGAGYLSRGMDFDRQGNLYVTDGSRIYRIDLAGRVSPWMSGFEDGMDLKVDPSGNVYVLEAQQCAVYKVTPLLSKSRLIDRGHPVRMREMASGIAFDPQFRNLYLAERVTGQILRYPLTADGQSGNPDLVAKDIVSLRSIVVDGKGNVFANIDFPIILCIDPQGGQTRFVIPNNYDFSMGRMSLGQSEGDRDSLYVPTKQGVVKITRMKGQP